MTLYDEYKTMVKDLRNRFEIFFIYLALFAAVGFLGKFFIWISLGAGKVASFSQFFGILFWALKFDISIGALLAFLLCVCHEVFRKKPIVPTITLFAFLMFLVSVIGSDLMYFNHVGRHISYEYATIFENYKDLTLSAMNEHPVAFYSTLGFVILSFFIARAVSHKTSLKFSESKLLNLGFIYFLILALGIVIFRGGPTGTALKPQHFYTGKDSRYPVLGWNAPYYLFHSFFFKAKSQFPNISTDDESVALWSKYYEPRPTKEIPPQKKYNVVFILLESWTGKYSIPSELSESITPFFNELSKKSAHTIATVAGGQRTSEGMFAVFCSFQNPLGLAIPDGNLNFLDYSCLPDYLKRNGYSSVFIQGTTNETSNVGPFAQKTGFAHSYGKQSYSNKQYDPNNWGYYDQDVYGFALEQMDQMKEPFVVGINTNTTHSNQLPGGVDFKYGSKTAEDTYKSVIHFADGALKEFLEKAEKKKYFDNTIFVLVSDHTGYSNAEDNAVYRFLIPGMIYAPQIVKPEKLPFVSTQRDLAPTVVDILGGSLPTLEGVSWYKKDRKIQPPEFYSNSSIAAVTDTRIVSYDMIGKTEKCFSFDFTKFPEQPKPDACNDDDKKHSSEVQAFTRMSQSLLMQGKTKELPDFGKLYLAK